MGRQVTAFKGAKRLVSASIDVVAPMVKRAMHDDPSASILIFCDVTGEQLNLNLRGSEEQIADQYSDNAKPKAGPGRPKLGVVAREVTLLPRHWEWLGNQPGGASVTLRKLVDAASRPGETDPTQGSREACSRFLSTMGGNLTNFEEANRALLSGDRNAFRASVAAWPMDIQVYALKLAHEAWI